MSKRRIGPSSGRISEGQLKCMHPRDRRHVIVDLGCVGERVVAEFVGGLPERTCKTAVNYVRGKVGGLGAVASALYSAGGVRETVDTTDRYPYPDIFC